MPAMLTRRLVTTLAALLFSLAALAPAQADDIYLNFTETDINTLIQTVAETSGKNFIVDPRVKGKVTVISSEPMDSETLYQTFLSILEVHGFAAIPYGNVVKVVPQNDAKQLGRIDPTAGFNDDLITRAINIEHVNAAQLVPILRPLLPQYGHLAAYSPSNTLIISDRQANVKRILEIVKRIDQPGKSEVDVVTLTHASADDVVKMLQNIEKASAGGQNNPSSVSFLADARTNAVLISGEKADRNRIKQLIKSLDTPGEEAGNTNVVYLRYAKATELAKILQGYAKASAQQSNEGKKAESDVTIFADESTNSLVITAPPRLGQEIHQVIDSLDIRRAQVLVEAIIAEISLDKAMNLGFNYAGLGNAGGFILEAGAFNTSSLASAITGDSNALAGIGALPGLTYGGVSSDNGEIEFLGLLRAVATDADNNIISTPSLLAMDNQEAEISIGQEVPFITGQYSGTNGGSNTVNPFTTIERKDVGVTLKITPHVIDNGTVELKIYQEVSGIASSATSSAADVITNKRTIDTTVIVDNGEIIALGGLLEDSAQDSRTKVPILGDIPGLGALFRSKDAKRIKRNLMVFIRPVVLQEGQDLRKYSQNRYQLLQQMQMHNETVKGGILPPIDQPASTLSLPVERQTDVLPMYNHNKINTAPTAAVASPETKKPEDKKPLYRLGPRR